jgi:chromosome segregation ATPase
MMMDRKRGWSVGLALGVLLLSGSLAVPVWGQEESSAEEAVDLSSGLWPTQKLMRSMVERWAMEMTDQYELDEEASQRVREDMLARWPAYLESNRTQIQPVLNQFLEMRMGVEPPTKEEVSAWAAKAKPILESMSVEFEAGSREFKEVLRPLQKARFELEALKYRAGMTAARAKLNQWEQGEFDPRDFWEPTRVARRKEREARQAAEAAAAGVEAKEPEDQIELELENWDRYVRTFIEIYGLDDAQRDAARSMLTELKQRALDHRDRNSDRIQQLELRIADGDTTDEQVAEIKQQLVELYGPIDKMFTELKDRLNGIPTTQQRASVQERHQERERARRAEAEAQLKEARAKAEEARAKAEAAQAAAEAKAAAAREDDGDGDE